MYGTYCVLYRAEHWQKPLRGCCHYGAYTMGHYHLEDVYTRFALGEVAAMVFIPLAFLALYDLTEMGHSRKRPFMCIIFVSYAFTHDKLCIMCSHGNNMDVCEMEKNCGLQKTYWGCVYGSSCVCSTYMLLLASCA